MKFVKITNNRPPIKYIDEWLDNNLSDSKWYWRGRKGNILYMDKVGIVFERDEDAIWFALKWR